MSELPELPVARRRKTAAMICFYLDAEITEKRIDLLSKVLLAGEMELIIREDRLRVGDAIREQKRMQEVIRVFRTKLEEIRREAEAFFILEDSIKEATDDIPPTEKTV